MRFVVLCFAIFTFIISLSASEVWNTPTCIRHGDDIQWKGNAAETNDGNVIYTWSDMHTGSRMVYCQEFSKQGNPLWLEPLALDNGGGNQQFPCIVRASTFELVICWIDYSENSYGNIYAQRINLNGTVIWQTGKKLVNSSVNYKYDLKLVAGNNGRVYIFWEDYRNNNLDIYGQCLNSLGAQQWTTEGKQLTFMPYDDTNALVVNDTYNGFMMGYNYKHGGNVYSFINHYNDYGNMSWDIPLQIDPGHSKVTLTSLKPYLAASYIYTWNYYDGDENHISMQRIDSSAHTYWDEPLIPDTYITGKHVLNSQCAVTLDNKIDVTWEVVDDITYEKNLMFQKCNGDGTLDGSPITLPLSIICNRTLPYTLVSDMNGGCYIAYRYQSMEDPLITSIHAFHIGADNSMMFGEQGVLTTEYAKYDTDFNLLVNGNSLHISWWDFRNGNAGIYSQLYNVNGTAQLDNGGKSIIYGISNSIDFTSVKTLHRSNDTIVFWQDKRFNDRNCIYYQIINEEGVPLLEVNGRSLNAYLSPYESHYTVCLGENDEVAIAWEVNANPEFSLRAQLIDAQGNPLWGENGLNISGPQSISQIMPCITYQDGAYYFAWIRFDNKDDPNSAIMGQKVVNGQLQWSADCVHISDPDRWVYEVNMVSSGRYFTWTEYDDSGMRLKVQHLTPEGIAAPGWPQYGRNVDDYEAYNSQYEPLISSDEEGVYLSWLDNRSAVSYQLYAQKISANGQVMWNPNSIVVFDQSTELFQRLQILSDNQILFCWSIESQPASGLLSKIYDHAGTMIADNTPFLGTPNVSYFDDLSGCRFDNGGYLFTVVTNSGESILHNLYMADNGILIGSANGSLIHTPFPFIRSSNIVSHGENAYIAWAEYANRLDNQSTSNSDIKGLYLQKLNNETVGTHDPTTPATLFSLSQNYPNPFNPETTIKYTLPVQANVKLDIYNVKGQKVRTLLDDRQTAGNHEITWYGTDDHDKSVSSGVYFYRLTTGNKTIMKKMVMVK
ncbi:MAG TPA: T9SS type A sorting domain-containing protein [Candidatus Cloacimonadota bacterium]|nr:T9SS type A sorting domain-containing protein [Candidatus Cloacimonadota bacterium]HPT70755.1 T9SS type A sorting domain-containing protein [Candidatus Cloacimonadota bacterium]